MLIGDVTEVNTLHMNLSILPITAKFLMFSLPRQDHPIRKDDRLRRGSDTDMLLYCHAREQRGQKHGVPRSPSLQQSNPHLTHTLGYAGFEQTGRNILAMKAVVLKLSVFAKTKTKTKKVNILAHTRRTSHIASLRRQTCPAEG